MRPYVANPAYKKSPLPSTVGDLIRHRKCLTFHPDEFINVILPLLQGYESGVAGVVGENGNLLGLLTEREILRRIYLRAVDPFLSAASMRKAVEDMTVGEAMIKSPVVLTADTPFDEAAGLMLHHDYRYMPVVGVLDRAHLLGIVSEREVAEALKNGLEEAKRSERENRALLSYMLHEPYGTGFQAPGP